MKRRTSGKGLVLPILFLCSIGFGWSVVQAQDTEFIFNTGVKSLAREGAVTINVNFISSRVQSAGFGQEQSNQGAGRYAIPRGMRLDEFLYTVGAFSLMGEVDDRIFLTGTDKMITTMRLSRNTPSGRVIIYEEVFETLLTGLNATPVLEEGDIIIVDRDIIRGRDPIRTFNYFTGAVSVATLVVTLVTLLR